MGEKKLTPLHELHEARGAKLVDFAGWEMPVHFAGVLPEHLHTRAAASLFDVSHMGQILVRAADMEQAAALLESVTPASMSGLAEGRQRYCVLTNGPTTSTSFPMPPAPRPTSWCCAPSTGWR